MPSGNRRGSTRPKNAVLERPQAKRTDIEKIRGGEAALRTRNRSNLPAVRPFGITGSCGSHRRRPVRPYLVHCLRPIPEALTPTSVRVRSGRQTRRKTHTLIPLSVESHGTSDCAPMGGTERESRQRRPGRRRRVQNKCNCGQLCDRSQPKRTGSADNQNVTTGGTPHHSGTSGESDRLAAGRAIEEALCDHRCMLKPEQERPPQGNTEDSAIRGLVQKRRQRRRNTQAHTPGTTTTVSLNEVGPLHWKQMQANQEGRAAIRTAWTPWYVRSISGPNA